MKNAVCILLCLFFLVMCNNHPKELLPELSYAESLMQRCPEKALAVLDSMEAPSPSDEFQYATWCLLITQARDKNYVKHTSDSLINIALDYFEKQHDPIRKATALYYEGRVNHDMNNAEVATDYYLRARDVALNTTDYKLLYLINLQLGSLYAFRGLADLALEAYNNAHNYAIQLKDSAFISNIMCQCDNNFQNENLSLQPAESSNAVVDEKIAEIDLLSQDIINAMNKETLNKAKKLKFSDSDFLQTKQPMSHDAIAPFDYHTGLVGDKAYNNVVYINALNRAKKHLSIQNGRLVLNIKSGKEINIAEDLYDFIKMVVGSWNVWIEEGRFEIIQTDEGYLDISPIISESAQ